MIPEKNQNIIPVYVLRSRQRFAQEDYIFCLNVFGQKEFETDQVFPKKNLIILLTISSEKYKTFYLFFFLSKKVYK